MRSANRYRTKLDDLSSRVEEAEDHWKVSLEASRRNVDRLNDHRYLCYEVQVEKRHKALQLRIRPLEQTGEYWPTQAMVELVSLYEGRPQSNETLQEHRKRTLCRVDEHVCRELREVCERQDQFDAQVVFLRYAIQEFNRELSGKHIDHIFSTVERMTELQRQIGAYGYHEYDEAWDLRGEFWVLHRRLDGYVMDGPMVGVRRGSSKTS